MKDSVRVKREFLERVLLYVITHAPIESMRNAEEKELIPIVEVLLDAVSGD